MQNGDKALPRILPTGHGRMVYFDQILLAYAF